jgi:hypothetical protein
MGENACVMKALFSTCNPNQRNYAMKLFPFSIASVAIRRSSVGSTGAHRDSPNERKHTFEDVVRPQAFPEQLFISSANSSART